MKAWQWGRLVKFVKRWIWDSAWGAIAFLFLFGFSFCFLVTRGWKSANRVWDRNI